MSTINYPGKICLAIYRLLNTNPVLFQWLWPTLFVLLVALLVFITLIKYDSLGETGRKIKSRMGWVVSEKLFIAIICLGTLVLRIPNLIVLALNTDESQWILNAATFYNGSIMWRDLSGVTSGPLVFVPINIMLLLGDGLNYTTMRLFGILFCILPSIVLIWLTVRRVSGELAARFTGIALFFYFASINYFDVSSYNSEHVPMLLISAGIYLLYRIRKNDNSLSIVAIAALGFVLGSMPYGKLQSVPIGLALGLLAIIKVFWFDHLETKRKFIDLAVLLFFALVPTIAVALYLTHYNCWADFINDYIFENLYYARTGSLGPFHYSGPLRWFLLVGMISHSVAGIAFVAAQVLIALCGIVLVGWRRRRLFKNHLFLESAWILFASYMAVVAPSNYYNHYQVLFIIPFAFFIGNLLGIIFQNDLALNLNIRLSRWYGIILIVLAASAFFVPNMGVMFVEKHGDYYTSKVAEATKPYTRPNERMATWGWGETDYITTGLLQGTKRSHIYYEVTLPLKDNVYIDEYVREMTKNKPVVFLDQICNDAFMLNKPEYRHENYPLINDYVSRNYTFVADSDGRRVYILNSRLQELGKK